MIATGAGLLTLLTVLQGVPDFRHEPSPAFPFGRAHPDAPAQLADFAFMIGSFNCHDERRLPDGSMQGFDAVWTARYFLNGHAIQDQYWAQGFYTSNIRQLDESAGVWRVHYLSEPGYASGVWSGTREGDEITLTRDIEQPGGGVVVSRLTFSNLSGDGFAWRSESLLPDGSTTTGWTSDCVRAD
jgi:hypothetical protein|tara:strand:- start:277 stop:831 length:555 start_codon:yes stop_codon:yes gene_type:complete